MPYYGYGAAGPQGRPAHADHGASSSPTCSRPRASAACVSIDLHAGQIQGFFNIPFDHLFAHARAASSTCAANAGPDAVFVSPDAGGVERTRAYAKRIDADLAIIDKRRESANVSEVMHIIGDVEDATA